MLGIILATETPIRVQERTSGHIVSMSDNSLQPGAYDIYCDGTIQVNDQPCVQRITSFNVSGHEDAFRNGIRARDGKCVISGMVNRMAPFNWKLILLQVRAEMVAMKSDIKSDMGAMKSGHFVGDQGNGGEMMMGIR